MRKRQKQVRKKVKIPPLETILKLESERMKQDEEWAIWLHSKLPEMRNKTISDGDQIAVYQQLEARYLKYHAKG